MRQVFICLLCGIVVMTMATSVLAQDADPCAGVRCHDNSKCAVRDSKLVCVCDKGYQAEAEGSGCKPKPPETDADSFVASSAIVTGLGALAAITGGVLIIAGNNECDGQECDDPLPPGTEKVVTGIPFLTLGGVMFITGVVLLSVGIAKREKIKREKLAFDINTKHGKLTLEPIIAAGENGGMFGLSGRF